MRNLLFLPLLALLLGVGPSPGFIHTWAPISVKEAPYNATGNGSTDDTAAIQAAVNFAGTQGGGTVIFPQGCTFVTSAPITGVQYVNLKGMGNGSFIQFNGVGFYTFMPGSFIGLAGWEISNLTIRGSSAATYCIQTQNCDAPKITNCFLKGMSGTGSNQVCLHLVENVYDGVFQGNAIDYSCPHAVWFDGASTQECNNNHFIENIVEAFSTNCMDGFLISQGSQKNQVAENTFEGAGLGQMGISDIGSWATNYNNNFVEGWTVGALNHVGTSSQFNSTISDGSWSASSAASFVMNFGNTNAIPSGQIIIRNNQFPCLGNTGFCSVGVNLNNNIIDYTVEKNRPIGCQATTTPTPVYSMLTISGTPQPFNDLQNFNGSVYANGKVSGQSFSVAPSETPTPVIVSAKAVTQIVDPGIAATPVTNVYWGGVLQTINSTPVQ